MPVDGPQPQARGREALGLHHTVLHALRSVHQRLAAWRATPHREALPDAVIIGSLRRPKLAIAMRATVVPTETAPPPIREFLKRIVAHPLRPYCPLHREVRRHYAQYWAQYQEAISGRNVR